MAKGFVNYQEAISRLKELGYKPWYDADLMKVSFWFYGNKVILWCRKGWFSGKGLEAGYGLDNLIEQLKDRPLNVKILK